MLQLASPNGYDQGIDSGFKGLGQDAKVRPIVHRDAMHGFGGCATSGHCT